MMAASLPAMMGRALRSGSAGHPVALRLIHYGPTAGHRESSLERLAAWSVEWLGAEVQQVYAVGKDNEGSALLLLEQGKMAIVSAGATSQDAPHWEATLFGTGGSLFLEADSQPDESPVLLTRDFAARLQAVRTEWPDVSLKKRAPEERSRGLVFDNTAIDLPNRKPPFGVLLVAGDHTHQPGYGEAFSADPRCRLIAVADSETATERRHALNAAYAERLGLPYYRELDSALTRDDVDIVSVCVEPRRRAAVIRRAAAAKKHLYLDKPLCAREEELDEICNAVNRAGVLAHMFSQVLWEPAVEARMQVEEVGELRSIHTDLCFAKGHAGTASLGSARQENATPEIFELPQAKRELTNVGVYCVVSLLRLLRSPVTGVAATTGNFFFREHQACNMEDFGQILLSCADGSCATVTSGRTGWYSHPAGGVNRTVLRGSRGVRIIDAYRPQVQVWCRDSNWTAPERDPEDPMGMWTPLPDSRYVPAPKRQSVPWWQSSWQTDVSHFVDCVQEGRQPAVPVDLAAEASRILFAAYRSASERRVIQLS